VIDGVKADDDIEVYKVMLELRGRALDAGEEWLRERALEFSGSGCAGEVFFYGVGLRSVNNRWGLIAACKDASERHTTVWPLRFLRIYDEEHDRSYFMKYTPMERDDTSLP